MQEKILISHCLLGKNCRFDGGNRLDKRLIEFLHKNKLKAVGVCPEELGGLKGKRGPFEFRRTVFSVIKRKTKVLDPQGKDYTKNFLKGADNALRAAKKNKVKYAVLKSKSPSCSPDYIYDGTFSRRLKRGLGLTAYILKKNKIKIFSDKDYFKLPF